MNFQTFCSCIRKLTGLIIFLSLAFGQQAFSLDYTVSPDGAGYKAVPIGGGQDITGYKAHEVINAAIQMSAGGKVHLIAGTYEVTDFDTITSDNANWVSARPDITIDNNNTDTLPPYQAQGSSVTKITINGDPNGDPTPGLIAYINFDTPIDLSSYPAMAYWLFPNKRIMTSSTVRFQFTFSKESNGLNPFRTVKVWHPEPGDIANHTQWRGHRLPSKTSDKKFLSDPSLPPLTSVKSIGLEIIEDNGAWPLGNTETVLYLDNLTGHYGQINMTYDNVVLEGEGPYHTILKMKDYGNLPPVYLTAKNAEIRYLQIHGNTDNASLIDYCAGIDAPWDGRDLANTKIHHNFIHQTQGSSIKMRGINSQIYENLLAHSENPMVDATNSQNTDIAYNTLKYCTNDAFIYLRNSSSFNDQVRNNSFWPISSQLRDSNSPDNPVSYSERFNSIIKRGIDAHYSTYGHTIKENKFYNLKTDNLEYQAVLISDGSHDILVKDNYFYNSNADIKWGAVSHSSHFIGNYFENGFLAVNAGYSDEFEGNLFTGASKLTLNGSSHYGGNNYFDSTSLFIDQSSGSSVSTSNVAPAFNGVIAGVSWEWGTVPNGGFEDGNGAPNGWVSVGSDPNTTHVWTADPNYGVHGIKAIQTSVIGLDATTAVNHTGGWAVNDYIRVSANETLTAHAIVKMENYQDFNISPGQDGLRFKVDYFKEDSSSCSVPSQTMGTLESDSSWTRLKQDISVPADCAKLRLGLYLSNANGTFTVDEVKLSRKMQGTVTVSKGGSGNGVVTSNPAGINCGNTCSAYYDASTLVILTAEAANDSVFTGWNGCDMPVGNTCSVGINNGRNVTANFALKSDLSITLTDTPDPALINDNITYTLTATNNGPSPASSVTVTDGLPSGTSYVSATPSQGSCNGTSTVTCNLGTLSNSAVATVTIVAKATTTGTKNSTATVSSVELDPNATNNAVTTSTTVVPSCSTGSYKITGAVRKDSSNGTRIVGATLRLSKSGCGNILTTANRDYSFTGLNNGTYTIVPSKTGCTFTPASRSITVNNGNVSGWSKTGFVGGGASCTVN